MESLQKAEGKDKEPVKEKEIPAEVLMALGLGWLPWWNTDFNAFFKNIKSVFNPWRVKSNIVATKEGKNHEER